MFQIVLLFSKLEDSHSMASVLCIFVIPVQEEMILIFFSPLFFLFLLPVILNYLLDVSTLANAISGKLGVLDTN